MADNLLQDSLAWMRSPERTQAMQGVGGMFSSAVDRLKQSSDRDYANAQQWISDPLNASPELMSQITGQGGSLSGFAPAGMVLGKTATGMAPLVQQADRLAAQGYPQYKITELTGLEKVPTPGGFEWGKQIPDMGASLNKEAFDKLTYTGVPLSDILDHPELFKAYPDLKNLKVEQLNGVFRGFGASGVYSPTQDVIELNKHLAWGDAKYKDALSTLLHEVQHSIQKREQWPGGTNPGQFTPESSKRIKTSLYNLEDNLAKEASLLSGNNVSRNTINNVLNYLEGTTKVLTKQDTALLESLKGNKELGEVVNRYQSFDGIRERLKARDVKAMGQYNKAASEVQARAVQNQFEQGKMTVPLTKTQDYRNVEGSLLYTDPMGFTIK